MRQIQLAEIQLYRDMMKIAGQKPLDEIGTPRDQQVYDLSGLQPEQSGAAVQPADGGRQPRPGR